MVVGRVSLFVVLVALAIQAGWSAAAQPPGLPIEEDLTSRTFTIRVVNEMRDPIHFKMVGGPGRSYFQGTLRQGQSHSRRGVTFGDKALCIWDATRQNLRMVWAVRVDRNGVVRIPEAAPVGELRLEIQPE